MYVLAFVVYLLVNMHKMYVEECKYETEPKFILYLYLKLFVFCFYYIYDIYIIIIFIYLHYDWEGKVATFHKKWFLLLLCSFKQ